MFLGRNWNNGETVGQSFCKRFRCSKDTDLMVFLELVLRDASGLFYPISMLLSVFCHEVSHEYHSYLLA